MKPSFCLLVLLMFVERVDAQFISFSPNADTSRHAQVTLEGYVDSYFAFDLNQPKDANRPYFVSQARQNEFNINLAYLSLKYSSDRVRATFTPGLGTYMNANYAAERVTLRNIVEANVGVRLCKKRNIWLDAGVIGSPYTNESAISLDQLTLSRSFASEYVPYYLTGAKLSIPIGKKVTAYLLYLNGWQVIEDVNTPLSFGSSLEIRPSDRLTVTWNTYYGNESSASVPTYNLRYFTDLYAVWYPSDHWSVTACIYTGNQERRDSSATNFSPWWQANTAIRYAFNARHSLTARVEYFEDTESVLITPITGVKGFDCSSVWLGWNLAITKQTMFRLEGRFFQSGREVFLDDNVQPSKQSFVLMGGLTARF